jgi:hypothetical protein
MQYLVEAENIDGLIPMKDVPDYLNHIVIPSYEQLIEWESENKIKGRLLAGQRAGAFVIDASSNEELGKILEYSILGHDKVEGHSSTIIHICIRTGWKYSKNAFRHLV